MRQILAHSAQLGQILATRRRASKLSQRALAAKLAISQNRLSEIETGPGTLTVERLLELFNHTRVGTGYPEPAVNSPFIKNGVVGGGPEIPCSRARGMGQRQARR